MFGLEDELNDKIEDLETENANLKQALKATLGALRKYLSAFYSGAIDNESVVKKKPGKFPELEAYHTSLKLLKNSDMDRAI